MRKSRCEVHFSEMKARRDRFKGSEIDQQQVVKLGVLQAEVNIPRLVEHTKDD